MLLEMCPARHFCALAGTAFEIRKEVVIRYESRGEQGQWYKRWYAS